MMRCVSCSTELEPAESGRRSTAGDCHPLCRDCFKALGRRVRPTPRTLRRSLYADGRNLSHCQACDAAGEVEVHFLLPLVRGGSAESANLLVLCRACHEKVHRGARIIVRARTVRDDPDRTEKQ